MSKIGIIIQREYKTRVMKKSFLLLTFLTPVLLTALMMVPIWLSSFKDDVRKQIIVVDKTQKYHDVLKSNENYSFVFSEKSLEEIKNSKDTALKSEDKSDEHSDKKTELVAILYINENLADNPKGATLYSDKQIDMELPQYLTSVLNQYVRDEKLASYDIPDLKEKIEESKTNIKISTIKWSEDGKEKQTSPEIAMILGLISAFLIYMFIMTYGSQVMNGVVQEKTNRIVEVIISSVKPFELMMGKIIGIALVGLTQFLLWVILTVTIVSSVSLTMGVDLQPTDMQTSQMMLQNGGQDMEMMIKTMAMINSINWVKTISLFLFYFLGGYLLYSSFFAAIGSAVDSETDTQQFSMPITLPIFFGIFVATYSVQNPNGPLAFWCSIIPLTSPIVMMVRIPFDVPLWQLALSMSVLTLSFIGSTWLAGKIYRTGILMYGKKVSWKEMWKWIKQS